MGVLNDKICPHSHNKGKGKCQENWVLIQPPTLNLLSITCFMIWNIFSPLTFKMSQAGK